MPPASIVFGLWHVPSSKKVEEIIVSWTWWAAPPPPTTTNRSLSCPLRRGVLYFGQWFCRRFLKKSLRLLVEFNVSLDGLLSVTLAPQNAALSSRNVGTDTVDRTVATHHCNIYHFRRINLSRLAFYCFVQQISPSIYILFHRSGSCGRGRDIFWFLQNQCSEEGCTQNLVARYI